MTLDARFQLRVQRYGWDKAADHYEQFWQTQLAPAQARLLELAALKPTIIRTAEDWEAQNRRSRAALDDMDATRARVIQLDGTAK